jgi:hypothetical protein
LIAEGVLDLETHERLLGNGGYRPSACPRCGATMHIHEYRERVLAGASEVSTEIAIFRCADRERCGAVTRVLPGLIARMLWRAWPTVEETLLVAEDAARAEEYCTPPTVPERTRRRWRARLAASAAALVVVLGTASASVPAFHGVVQRVGLDGTRAEFVAALADAVTPVPAPLLRLATTAAVIHRLARGVRLM